MAEIIVTRWRPDTCECVLEYAWERGSDATTRTHEYSATVAACPAHAAEVGPTHLDKVVGENRGKNFARQALLESVPEIRVTKTNDDGSTYFDFAPGREFEYSFDAARDLEVSVKGGVPANRRAAALAAISAKVGHGRTRVR